MSKKAKQQSEPEQQPVLEQVAEKQAQETQETEEAVEASIEDQLKMDLLEAREDAKSKQELYLRAMAEMDNLRKRTQREKEELAKFANENILREILPVIDNLERAIEHAEQASGNGGLLEGVQMTLTHFSQVLSRFGVEPVISLGLPFDPAVHQAMGQLETKDYPANTVAQEMQKGYLLNDRLLRPALVMVAKAPVPAEKEEEETDEMANVAKKQQTETNDK